MYIICSSLVTTVPILYMLSQYSSNQIDKYDQESIRLINNKLDTLFRSVESSEYTISTDNDFIIPLTLYYDIPGYKYTQGPSWFDATTKIMQDTTLFQTGLEFIVLGKDGPLPIYSSPELVNNSFIPSNASWYETVVRAPNQCHVFFNNQRDYYLGADKAVSVIKAVPDIRTHIPLAFVVIDIPYSQLWNIIDEMTPSIPIVVHDRTGRLMFSNVKSTTSTAGSRHTWSIDQTSSFTGITVTSYSAKSLFINEIGTIVLISLMIMVVFLLVVFIVSSISTRRFSRQIHLLMDKMAQVLSGNYDVKLNYGGSIIEMANLYDSFDRLVVGTRDLIKSNYEVNLLKSQAELEALQQKINPHFLYNTLETISSQAIIDGSVTASTMCQKLGALFAYSLREDDLVTIGHEVKQLKNYVYIAQISAYAHDVHVEFNIDSLTIKQLIPKMTLQPLVENCLRHGSANALKHKLHITVASRIMGDSVVIEISDNGKGMSERQLRDINENLTKSYSLLERIPKSHIGLQHVNARYKLIYGERYHMDVESTPQEGTRIALRVPINNLEESGQHVQGAYS